MNGKKLRNLDDLKNLKMWLWEGDPLPEAFFEVAGVAPVSLTITDVFIFWGTSLPSSVGTRRS